MKKVLCFYPHNFFEMSSGTHRRFYEIAEYLRSRRVAADLVTLDGFTNTWDKSSLQKGSDFFRDIYVCPWKPVLKNRIFNKIATWSQRRSLSDFATPALRSTFKELFRKNDYNFFFNSYVYWEKLADDCPPETISIIDIHDLITLNEHMRLGNREFRLGGMFQQEINAVNKYDYVLSISEEEMLFLEPFCSRPRFINIPVTFDEKFAHSTRFRYDGIFIGSDNPFNKEGADWFLNSVYPLLPDTMTFAVVGRIATCIEKRPNITVIPFAENLDSLYTDARMVICPLLSGTGLKVKVVEALAHGKPVVTTKWGLSGILQKENNGCIRADTPGLFAHAIMRLTSDDPYYRTKLEEARVFFSAKYSRNACWKKLDGLFLG